MADAVYRLYADQYSYDRTPFDARVESTDDASPHWRHEVVNIATVYGGERMPVHLYLPKNVKPPYQAVLFFPGTLAIGAESSSDLQLNTFDIDFIVMSGRALVYPVYQFTYGRSDARVTAAAVPPDASQHHLGAATRERCQAGARLCRNEAGHRRRPADLLRFVVGRAARADHHRARPAHQGGCPAHGRSWPAASRRPKSIRSTLRPACEFPSSC